MKSFRTPSHVFGVVHLNSGHEPLRFTFGGLSSVLTFIGSQTLRPPPVLTLFLPPTS